MATEIPLLPRINRQFLNILDVSESGLVAFGSRCSIYIFHFKSVIPIIDDSKLIPNAHRGSIQCLSFCKTDDKLIASCGDDDMIRIWDLQNETCIANIETRKDTRVIEWIYGSSTNICFSSTLNLHYLSKWNYKTNKVTDMKSGSDSYISVLSSNKKSPELLAAGHTIGTICILNVNSHTLVYKLKSHLMEITSLCWSSVSPTMLVSTSLDQTARVWKMGENKPFRTFSYPRIRKMEERKHPMKLCAIFHPENSDIIICSNVRGSLGEVAFKEEEHPKFDAYDETNSDYYFKTISKIVPYYRENKTLLLANDHTKISFWDISEKKFLSSYPYLFGPLYDLAASTLNPYNLAIGGGDGCLRVWNLHESARVDMTTVVIYTRTKVMAIAWHPTAEYLIAYGTDEGRIGIVDLQKKKSVYSYETHHTSTVYNVQWAPCFKIKDSEKYFFLYTCGGGSIYIYEPNKPKEKPADFDELITFPPDLESVKKSHSEFSWKSDFTCIIVGSNRGFIDLFDKELNFLARVTMQIKIIESIKWHPSHTFTSSKGSDYSSWFAAAGNDNDIRIYDTSDIKDKESESALCIPVKTLIGHKKKISSVSWSPHSDCNLVSASKDGTVLVWDVISSTIIAYYPWHKEEVYTAHWSYFDPDVIYSGGMDGCLRVWKISEQIKSAPEKSQVIRRKTRPIKCKNEFSRKEENSSVNVRDLTLCRESQKSDNTDNETLKENGIAKKEDVSTKDDYSAKNFKTRLDVSKETTSRYKNLFYGYMLGSKEEKLKNVLKLTDILSQTLDSSEPENMTSISDLVTDEESLHCGFYCDQLTALKMLDTKAKAERNAGFPDKAAVLQVMANDIESLCVTASESNKLTDFLMAAAATVSRKFYNEMCQKYAVQLLEERNYVKAGMYLIFCGDVHNAVKSLLDKERILEALAIAKARLPADDPFMHGVLGRALRFFTTYHQLELEAQCQLALKEPALAAQTLYRIGDSSSIYVSTYICKKYNLMEEAESYGYLCMEKCLVEAAWPTFYKVIELVDSLKVYRLFVRTHELIFEQMQILKKQGIIPSKLFGVTGNKLQIWESKAFGETSVPFLLFAYEILKLEDIIPENKESLEEIRSALDSFIAKRQKYETSAEVHINVAVYISQAIVSSLLNNLNAVQKNFQKVFSVAYNIAFMPRIVNWLFLPLDVYWCCSKDAFICENKYLDSQPSTFAHLQNIYESLCDKFALLNTSTVKGFSIYQDFLSNLEKAVEQILKTLSTKTCSDSLILYFSACYITELRKLAKHGWKYRCYVNATSCKEKSEEFKPEDGGFIVSDEKNGENSIYIDHKNVKECIESEANCYENTDQNIHPNKLLVQASLENEIMNHISSQDKDNILSSNSTPPLFKENNLTANSSLPVDDIKNENLITADMLSNGQDFLIPHNGVENGLSKNFNNKIESEIPPVKEINNEISVKDNIKNAENLNITDMLSKSQDFLIPHNGAAIENGLSKNVGNKVENEILPTTKTENEISPLKEIDSEISSKNIHEDENEKIELCLPECSFKVEDMSIEAEDDHLQCWSDVSLLYTLIESFTSACCRDEYALFFHLQKYLQYLDNTIADISRQKSVKSVLSKSKELPLVGEEESLVNQSNASSNPIESENNHQENPIICTSESVETLTNTKENDISYNSYDNECALQEKEIKNEVGEIQVESKKEVGGSECSLQDKEIKNVCKIQVKNEEEVAEIKVKSDKEVGNIECSLQKETGEIKIENEKVGDNKCSLQDEEMQKEVGEIRAESELIDKFNMKNIPMSEDSTNSVQNEKINETEEYMVLENLYLEKERVSQSMKLLNSVEFDYPNPFDTVSALNAICYYIFCKNPCNFVRKKFHEFIHKVNKWNAKFCVKDQTIKCDICQLISTV